MNPYLFLFLLGLSTIAIAQVTPLPPELADGGSAKFGNRIPHLTEAQRKTIQKRLQHNIQRLQIEGMEMPAVSVAPVAFIWPVKQANHVSDYGVDAISNFVDHDAGYPNQLLDYFCDTRTYDLDSGYNHAGIDIFSWPFSWLKMDNNDVEIVAAAPGQIIGKDDGNYDRNCGFGSGSWNAVYIRHADNSIAWYGHMKKESLTTKHVGDRVNAGEFLGVVGSSGNSTGPHLHFEVYDATYNLVDPYQGSCNFLNAESWWKKQPDYYQPRVNKLTTASAAPRFADCPNPATTNIKNTFQPGDAVYFSAYYRDQLNDSASHYSIARPDGTIYANWDHTTPVPHYAASYWNWYYTNFAHADLMGIWTFSVAYRGDHYSANFYMVDDCGINRTLYAQTISDHKTVAASDTLSTTGSVVVDSSGNATLLAQNKVTLNPGFIVEHGGSLTIQTDPGVCN